MDWGLAAFLAAMEKYCGTFLTRWCVRLVTLGIAVGVLHYLSVWLTGLPLNDALQNLSLWLTQTGQMEIEVDPLYAMLLLGMGTGLGLGVVVCIIVVWIEGMRE